MKSIAAVEYEVNGIVIWSSNKLKMEEAIMNENSLCFRLAYSSPLFHWEILPMIGLNGQNLQAQQLIQNNISLNIEDQEINQFLNLLY